MEVEKNNLQTQLIVLPCLLAISLFFLIINGCFPIPIPHSEWVVYGNRVEPAQLESFVPGITAQSEIEKLLGPPEVYWTDEKIAYYRWDVTSFAILFISTGPPAGIDFEDVRLLLFQYDDQNFLKRFEICTYENPGEVGRGFREWAEKGCLP